MPAAYPPHDLPAVKRAQPLPLVELEILRGRARSRRRRVEVPAFLIGRASDCDLVLGDPQFPEVFAYLRRTEQGVTIRQIGGGPELTCNGTPVLGTELADGDRLRMGGYEFQVCVRHEPALADPSVAVSPVRAFADPVEEHSAVVEVEALLADIRQALFPKAQPLRLYVDPETELREANLRAASLGWPTRRCGGW